MSQLAPTFEGDYSFSHNTPFYLDGGGSLQPVTLHYAMYGRPNRERNNVILVCHALSGSARAADWWSEVIGDGRVFDTARYCVVGINVIGSCYGSSGPRSINPQTGKTYGGEFPIVTVGDMVRAQEQLIVNHLGIERLYAVAGGSIGGMQALEWALRFPHRVARCISIGATPLSAMGLALNHLQRLAIQNDPDWQEGDYALEHAPLAGLALARAIAMCSYKSADLFNERFQRKPDRNGENPRRSLRDRFDVAGYLDYQAEIFTRRFDANSYLILSKAMDTFDIAGPGESEAETLHKIEAQLLLIGISSDWLFPASDVKSLVERFRLAGIDARYAQLRSSHGHDGFLADAHLLTSLVKPLLISSHEERWLCHAKAAASCV